jgi:sugar/nucleoside kinase (ribokinase family)
MIVGVGDPVLDVVVHVPHAALAALDAEPGGCAAVDAPAMAALLALPAVAAAPAPPRRAPGGSAANVCKVLAALAAGAREVRFVGMAGADAAGGEYAAALQAQGVAPVLITNTAAAAGATATCLCLVTPDGQRTMRTCLGAAAGLADAAQLPRGWAAPAAPPPAALELAHFEGYCLYRPAFAAGAMRAARAAGAKVSLDLASFEVVRARFAELSAILGEGLVDAVFCNEDEAAALAACIASEAGASGADAAAGDGDHAPRHPPRETDAESTALAFLLRRASLAVASRGGRGCAIAAAPAAGGGWASAPSLGNAIVDTVGAGDAFTAGVLHAWLAGASLEACARSGCAAGGAAVAVAGGELGAEAGAALRRHVERILAEDG